MHRTSGFTRLLGREGRSLSRYESLGSGQELDNLDPHNSKSANNDDPFSDEVDIYGWPREPMRLQRAPKVDRISALFLMLFPLPFIGLVIAALVLNNKPQSGAGEDVFWAMRLGPTVYPLVFASVAGTTLRTIALWKAERGTTVGTLERLLGSHTFVHAIENAVAMRLWSILTIFLLALWACSPIGGQGSLRLMYVTNSTETTEGIPIVYTQPDLTVPHIRDTSTDLWAGAVPRFEIDHIISASLTVSDAWRNNPVDPWGRPKIPLLKGISDAGNKASSDWINVVQGRDTTFTSLVGIGIPSFTETLADGEYLNFTTPFEYLEATCNADSVVKLEDVRSYIRSYGSIAPRFRRNSTDPYDTLQSPRPSRTGGTVRTNFFLSAGSPKNTTAQRSDEAPLVWGIFGLGGMHIYHCSLRMFRVDVATQCQGSICTAQALRLSKTTDEGVCSISDTSGCFSDLVKPFSLPLQRFLEFLPTAMTGNNDFNCPVYEYLFGYPPQPARDPLTPAEKRDWSQVPEALMSSRLTTLINTFWYAWLWNDEVYTRSAFDSHDRYANTTATQTRVRLIYKVDKGWAVALSLSAGILLILSTINSIILFKIRGPDPFGYMSVTMREGMHSGVPKTGTALNGYEIARMLAHEGVQLTDVQPEKDVGKIALKRMGKHERMRKELDRSRLYI